MRLFWSALSIPAVVALVWVAAGFTSVDPMRAEAAFVGVALVVLLVYWIWVSADPCGMRGPGR